MPLRDWQPARSPADPTAASAWMVVATSEKQAMTTVASGIDGADVSLEANQFVDGGQ